MWLVREKLNRSLVSDRGFSARHQSLNIDRYSAYPSHGHGEMLSSLAP